MRRRVSWAASSSGATSSGRCMYARVKYLSSSGLSCIPCSRSPMKSQSLHSTEAATVPPSCCREWRPRAPRLPARHRVDPDPVPVPSGINRPHGMGEITPGTRPFTPGTSGWRRRFRPPVLIPSPEPCQHQVCDPKVAETPLCGVGLYRRVSLGERSLHGPTEHPGRPVRPAAP